MSNARAACFLQDGEISDESDGDEPAPEALARYLSMRRHTVGVSDGRWALWRERSFPRALPLAAARCSLAHSRLSSSKPWPFALVFVQTNCGAPPYAVDCKLSLLVSGMRFLPTHACVVVLSRFRSGEDSLRFCPVRRSRACEKRRREVLLFAPNVVSNGQCTQLLLNGAEVQSWPHALRSDCIVHVTWRKTRWFQRDARAFRVFKWSRFALLR